MSDDILRGIYSVCPEIGDITGKRLLHFFYGGFVVVPGSEGRTMRSFHNLYHHMSSVIVDEVSFRIFSIRIRPFAIWIVFILSVFERSNFPCADQLLLHWGNGEYICFRIHFGSFGMVGPEPTLHSYNENKISHRIGLARPYLGLLDISDG